MFVQKKSGDSRNLQKLKKKSLGILLAGVGNPRLSASQWKQSPLPCGRECAVRQLAT